jgi:hypothetical protein
LAVSDTRQQKTAAMKIAAVFLCAEAEIAYQKAVLW